MTARDATLVIVQADRGVYMASLVPALLMAPRARVCLRVFKYVKAPIDCGAIHQCCLDVDSSCSSAEGNAQRARGKSSVCVCVCERARERELGG